MFFVSVKMNHFGNGPNVKALNFFLLHSGQKYGPIFFLFLSTDFRRFYMNWLYNYVVKAMRKVMKNAKNAYYNVNIKFRHFWNPSFYLDEILQEHKHTVCHTSAYEEAQNP